MCGREGEGEVLMLKIDKGRAIRNAELSTARREGREEGKIEMANNFLKMGLSPEQVAQGTGLSIEQVKELERQLQ